MGTRSLTLVREGKTASTTLVNMYRQMDGYPSGHGQELIEFLDQFKIVNGIGSQKCITCGVYDYQHNNINDHDLKVSRIANGMGCLTAQLIAHFKKDSGVGGIYLYPPKTRDCGEEYIYTVYLKDVKKKNTLTYPEKEGQLYLRVQAGAMTFFGLPGTKQKNMPIIWDAPVSKWDLKEVEMRAKAASEAGIPNDFIATRDAEYKKAHKA